MLRKMYDWLALACIMATLTVVMVMAAVYSKGRLSSDNCAALGRMLRGEPIAEAVKAPLSAATQPAQGRDVTEQAIKNQEQAQMDNLVLQRRLEELNHQRLQLESLEREVAQERAALREERLAWARAIDAVQQDKHGEAFAKQLKLFETLAPRQVKDILVDMGEDRAASYLSAMKRDTAADVIARFKDPQEKQFLQRVLNKMRQSS